MFLFVLVTLAPTAPAHAMQIRGKVLAWGDNSAGQTTVPDYTA